MSESFGQILLKYYTEKLLAEREVAIQKMKIKLLFKELQLTKERLEKKEKEEKNNLMKEIQNLIKIENEKFYKKIIDETKIVTNSIKNEFETLKENIAEIKHKLIPKEEEVDGEISKDNTEDIWDAAAKSLPAVKFYYKADRTSVNQKNKQDYNRTPLYYAPLNGRLDIVEFLISKGADVNSINSLGSSPLMAAAKKKGNLPVINYLLDHGADMNQTDRDKETAIYYAIYKNDLDAVKLLIARGADRYIQNFSGKTPLDYAKAYNKTSIVNYLSSL